MAAKVPIRAVFDGSTATGLAEFQSTEFIALTYGGLGVSLSLGTAGQVMKVNSDASALEFGDVPEQNIDGMTDGSGITLAASDKFAVSDGGTEKYLLASQIDTYVSATSSTLTNKTLTTPIITEIDSGSTITLDATTDIVLDADGGDIFFKDGGTTFGSATNTSGDLILKSGTTTAATFSGANVTLAGTVGSGAITSTGVVTATGFTIGSAVIVESELEMIDGITAGTVAASKAVVVDSNKDAASFRNITLTGELDAATLDISGNADIDGTLEADAYTVDGTALNEYIADTVGAMVSSNTETNITVTYEDGDNTLDFVIGTLNQDTSGTAALATSFTASANNSTDETVYPVFVDGATGTQGAETDTGLTYNPSTGLLTSTGFSGNLTGTLQTAAQGNVTSLGTLTALTVDDVVVNGKVITMTGSSSDTAVFTAGTNGTLSIVTTDAAAAAANITITADGTAELAGTTVTLNSSGGVTIDADNGTITFADAGSSLGTITSSGYSGTSTTVTVTDSTANTNFPVVFHDESNALLDDTGALRYNPSTGTLLVPNLTVAGTTTQVDTVTMNAANAVIFEGATADNYETTLSIVDPTADRTQYLINQGGYIPLLAAVTTTAITSTPAELNLLDGSSANSVVNSKAVIYGSSGEVAGTLSTAAQGNVTSLGTLTTLTVDNVIINGTTIGHTSDTDLMTVADGVLAVAGKITVSAEDAFVFEGATADAYETTLQVTDPTADRTIVLPDTSGQVQVAPPVTLNGTDGSSTNAGDHLVLDTAADAGDRLLYEDGTSDAIAVFASHGITLAGVGWNAFQLNNDA